MSSKSPRGSFSGSSAAEVAADYEESLKDLHINNRHEISNLTIIAKENTEHAQAISQALEHHIKTTVPTRKLPALYVLDSIVKNVGTPYNVYLGRNLFSTFMDAYTLVDTSTRRNMEGMLKTWKEPVPGSIDEHPVFPFETVRPIENALIKARTAAIQSQRQPYQATATPPQRNGQFMALPFQQQQHQHFNPYAGQQVTPQPHQYPFAAAPGQQQPHEIETLKRDLAHLISRDQAVLSTNVHDQGLRTRLSALRDLQTVIHSQALGPGELQAIRHQVTQLSAAASSQAPPAPQPPMPTPQPQWGAPQPQYLPPPHGFPATQYAPQPAPPTLTPQALNGLQALLVNAPKPSTPQMRAAVPGFQAATHAQLNAIQNHAAPAANAPDLLASLAKAGLIKPASTPSQPLSVPPTDPTASLLKSLQGILPLPPQGAGATPRTLPSGLSAANAPLSAASIKIFRQDLVHSLYDAYPNQCSTCGRRFSATEEGREKKSRHLDWHFRTNQRIADPNTNRGHHRNWFVDEREWIMHAEFDPSTTTANNPNSRAKVKKGPQDQFLRTPAGMTKNTCSICFEEMKSTYSEDQSDWIFTNATMYNNKIVHATCLAEMTQSTRPAATDGGALAAALTAVSSGKRSRSATPDSMLGKRKAETAMTGVGTRMKVE